MKIWWGILGIYIIVKFLLINFKDIFNLKTPPCLILPRIRLVDIVVFFILDEIAQMLVILFLLAVELHP